MVQNSWKFPARTVSPAVTLGALIGAMKSWLWGSYIVNPAELFRTMENYKNERWSIFKLHYENLDPMQAY
jgi:hypothetical protein